MRAIKSSLCASTGAILEASTDVTALVAAMPTTTRKIAVTALNQWRFVHGLKAGEEYLSFARGAFEANLEAFDRHADVQSLQAGTRNNRRAALRQLERLVANALAGKRSRNDNPYWSLLLAAAQTAKLTYDQRRNMLRAYSLRSMPRSLEAIERAAKLVGLDPDMLVPYVWLWRPSPLFEFGNDDYTYNEAHHVLTRLPYALDPLPPQLQDGFQPFLEWRRGSSPRDLSVTLLDGTPYRLKRSGAWSKGPGDTLGEPPPTEVLLREFLGWFFGFLVLPADHPDARLRGMGKAVEQLRLTDLFVGRNVKAFCEFQRLRNGRFDHFGLKKLRQDWCLLVGSKESWGRHAQQKLANDLAHSLNGKNVPETPAAWFAWCDGQLSDIDDWIDTETEGRTGKAKYRKARSMQDALARILELRAPMEEVVWPTIFWLSANRPPACYSVHDRMVFESHLFTIAALASEPHRVETWSGVRWGKDLRLVDGMWYLTIAQKEFKTRRFLSRAYKSRIEPAAQPFYTAFYEIWKEAFGYDPFAAEHVTRDSYVNAAARSPNKRPSHEVLRVRLAYLTEIWGTNVGPHAFRHLWATDWLKRNPHDYQTVAGKLCDKISTIIDQYAHIYSEDHSHRTAEANANLSTRAAENLARRLAQRKPQVEGRKRRKRK